MVGLSKKIAEYFIVENLIKKEDQEISQYGIQLILSSLFIILSITLIGMVTNTLIQAMVFMICFGTLRNTAGGKYAESYRTCYLVSIGLYIVSIAITNHIWFPYLFQAYVGVGAVAWSIVYFYAPVESPNKPLSSKEVIRYKKRSRRIITIQVLAILLLYYIDHTLYKICTIATIAILTETATLLPIFNRKGGKKVENN